MDGRKTFRERIPTKIYYQSPSPTADRPFGYHNRAVRFVYSQMRNDRNGNDERCYTNIYICARISFVSVFRVFRRSWFTIRTFIIAVCLLGRATCFAPLTSYSIRLEARKHAIPIVHLMFDSNFGKGWSTWACIPRATQIAYSYF